MENRNGAYALGFGIAGFIPMFGLVLGILAIVKGAAGISRDENRKYAIAGLVIGIISIVFNVIFFIYVILPWLLVGLLFWVCCLQFAEV